MSQPILDLSDPGYFQVVYETILNGQLVVAGRYIPIPQHSIPIIFDCHTLLVGATSATAKPNWRLGFYLKMLVVTSAGTAEASNRSIPFGLNLIRFPALSHEFKLKAYIPKWHRQVEMKIWKYTGPELDTLDLLEQIKSKTDLL